ncbi:MAG: type II toxin-antitoxin system VapC family toxin [Acidobacteria bacterium]|nr:type II toxin-antitoxin system VapC family toxin [Acidobacteriota bacterium]
MALYYLDTSALVKLYVREPGTEQMVRLASPSSGHTLAVLALARVEFRAAVRQRERKGDVPHDAAGALIARMEEHLQNLYLVQLVTEAVVEEAAALLDRHALRAYDAVQLAGCLSLREKLNESPSFVCFDRQLVRAAEREGLTVFDPVAEPSS